MRTLLSILLVAIAVVSVTAYTGQLTYVASLFEPGFTDSQIAAVNQEIRNYYVKDMKTPEERKQLETGKSAVEVTMMKMSARRLEGFVTISIHDEVARNLGLEEVKIPCEATMGVDSNQYLWKCSNK